MDLLREWRRRIASGTAVAVLIPVGIVAGALVIGVGGGFGGLGALGQALAGPDIPGVEPAGVRSGSPDDEAGDLLAAAARPAARRGTTTTAGRAPGARRRTTRRGGRSPGGSNRPNVAPTPDATPPPPPPSGGPQPTPAPTEPPSTVRQVGETVKGVTNQVPVAGEPVGQVVDTIVDTAEQLPLPKVPGVLP